MGIWSDLFSKHGHKKNKEIQELLAEIKKLEDELHTLNKNRGPRFIAFFSTQSFNKKSKFLITMLTLQVGQPGDEISIEVFDSISGNVLDKVVLSGQTYAVDNAAAVAATPDATDAGSEDVEPVAAGQANLSGTVVADLSAYGLGNAVTLTPSPVVINVTPAAVQVAPAARFKAKSQATGQPADPNA